MAPNGNFTPEASTRLVELLEGFLGAPTAENNAQLIDELNNGRGELYVRTHRLIGANDPPLTGDDLVPWKLRESGMPLRLLAAATTIDRADAAETFSDGKEHLSLVPSAHFMRACEEAGVIGFVLNGGLPTETLIGKQGGVREAPYTAVDRAAWRAAERPPNTSLISREERLTRWRKKRG